MQYKSMITVTKIGGMRDLNGFEDSASKKTGEHADSLEVSTEQLLDGLHLG